MTLIEALTQAEEGQEVVRYSRPDDKAGSWEARMQVIPKDKFFGKRLLMNRTDFLTLDDLKADDWEVE